MRAALAIVVLLAAASVARAEDARIAAARAAYGDLEQRHVLDILAPTLAGPLSEHDRAAALRLAGCAHMVLRERDAAIASFRQSFALEPDAALEPQLSTPDARSLFEIARGEWSAGLVTEMAGHAAEIEKIQLGVHAPATARGGRPLEIIVKFADPAQLAARIELAYRKRGQPDFVTMRQPPAPSLTFEIPAEVTESAKPYALEYHLTVRHQSGFDLRRDGDANHPHVIRVAAGHRPRWQEQWWVRGVIAAGVIGLGAGGYLFYRSIDIGPQNVVIGNARTN